MAKATARKNMTREAIHLLMIRYYEWKELNPLKYDHEFATMVGIDSSNFSKNKASYLRYKNHQQQQSAKTTGTVPSIAAEVELPATGMATMIQDKVATLLSFDPAAVVIAARNDMNTLERLEKFALDMKKCVDIARAGDSTNKVNTEQQPSVAMVRGDNLHGQPGELSDVRVNGMSSGDTNMQENEGQPEDSATQATGKAQHSQRARATKRSALEANLDADTCSTASESENSSSPDPSPRKLVQGKEDLSAKRFAVSLEAKQDENTCSTASESENNSSSDPGPRKLMQDEVKQEHDQWTEDSAEPASQQDDDTKPPAIAMHVKQEEKESDCDENIPGDISEPASQQDDGTEPPATEIHVKKEEEKSDCDDDTPDDIASGLAVDSSPESRPEVAPSSSSNPILERVEPQQEATNPLSSTSLRRSKGHTRKVLNKHLKSLGLSVSFGQTAVSGKDRNISHITLNSKWNKLPQNVHEKLQLWVGIGPKRLTALQPLNPAEKEQKPIPIFWAVKRKAPDLCHYVGHYQCVSFKSGDEFQIELNDKERQALLELKFVKFDDGVATELDKID